MIKQERNKLAFQLIVMLRKNISELIVIGIFSFCLALLNVQNLRLLKLGVSMKTDDDMFIIWFIIIALNISNAVLTNNYKQTAVYFLDIGYTRKKYYRGVLIFNLIISFFMTAVTFIIYIINLLIDKLYKLNGVIFYMGFHFEVFTAYSYIKIIIITLILITLICAFANFISVISFSNKFLRIIVNLMIFIPLLLIIVQENLNARLSVLVSYVNGYFSAAIVFYITVSIGLYILAEKIFTHIDID